jgi:hypothetical protein
MYNRDQFNKDLSLIVTVFGERRRRGFYTEGVYEDNIFRITDPYISEPQIHYGSTWVGKDDVEMNSVVARFVLKKAMQAEEIMEMKYGKF